MTTYMSSLKGELVFRKGQGCIICAITSAEWVT